jgi:cytochrome P450
MKTILTPPGPRGIPILGSSLNYFRDILKFLLSVNKEFGDIAYFKLGNRNMYMVSDPEIVKDVLVTNNRNFCKSRALQRAKLIVGEGLLTSEGDFHLKQRRMMQPVFHNRKISKYSDSMSEYALKESANWKHGDVIDIHKSVMKITLGVVVKSLFSSDIDSESSEIGKALTVVMKQFPRLVFPFSEYLDHIPLPGNIRCKKAMEKLDGTIYQMIECRRKDKNKYDDLLALLLDATDEEDNTHMDNEQLRDEAMTLFIAGQESTANAITWALYLISENRDVEKKISEEIKVVLGDRTPSWSDYQNLKYLISVFYESLRLYPPAWAVVRRAIRDYQLKDYIVPAGSDIIMSQYVIHRKEYYYTDPEKFIPERWTDKFKKDLPQYAFFPFGGGPRRCIGEGFAWMEGVLILAVLLMKWKMKLYNRSDVIPDPLVTLRPKNGLIMRMEKR